MRDLILGCIQLILGCLELLRNVVASVADNQPRRRAGFEQRLQQLLAPYMDTLVEKRTKLRVLDDYGEVQKERWSKELGSFLEKVLWPKLGADWSFAERNKAYVATQVDDLIEQEQIRRA